MASGTASAAAGAASPAGSDPSSAPPQPPRPEPPTVQPVTLTAYHYLTFAVLLGGGLLFLALLLYFTSNTSGTSMEFQRAVGKVIKRLLKTVALRQVASILAAMAFVRYALEPIIKSVRTLVKAQGTWEKSSGCLHPAGGALGGAVGGWVGGWCRMPRRAAVRGTWRAVCAVAAWQTRGRLPTPRLHAAPLQLYKPLEFLFLVSAFTTLAENFLPQLISIPKARRPPRQQQQQQQFVNRAGLPAGLDCLQMAGLADRLSFSPPVALPCSPPLQSIVQTVVRSTLSLTFVIASARVVFNIKGRIVRESAWQLELKGDLTRQRRLEAIDKLLSVLTLLVTAIFGLQALGLDGEGGRAGGGVAHIETRCCSACCRYLGLSGVAVCRPLAVVPDAAWPARPRAPQSTPCWRLEAWVAWRWVWLAGRLWRTCSRGWSSFPPTPLRWGTRSCSGRRAGRRWRGSWWTWGGTAPPSAPFERESPDIPNSGNGLSCGRGSD